MVRMVSLVIVFEVRRTPPLRGDANRSDLFEIISVEKMWHSIQTTTAINGSRVHSDF